MNYSNAIDRYVELLKVGNLGLRQENGEEMETTSQDIYISDHSEVTNTKITFQVSLTLEVL